ncbi:MAG: glycosyltransferase family 4 protein [Nitrososphaerota archaeon]|nr:glycosyltransferase family 4 protein [Nitrososphaerota archaeon]
MNILIVTFDPPQNVGGVEGRGNNYTKHLVFLGHNVEVISFFPGYDYSTEELHGAKLLKFPSSSSKAIRSLRLTAKEVSKNSIDSIFFLSGALTLYGLLLLLYARYKGIRTLAFYYGKDILTSKHGLFSRFALWISPKLSCKIAVNSRYTKRLLPKKYEKKSVVLYPAVDPGILGQVDVHVRKDDFQRILFVGRLVKRKGADDLLRSFREVASIFQQATLEIVGDGPELETLRVLSKDLGVSDRARFYGSLSGNPLYERYASCYLLVMPSRTTEYDVEGFGTVFLEAALFGKPSIGTRSGGIPEAIVDGETGVLVPEGDVSALSDALKKLLSDRDLALRLGESARKRVLTFFTWEEATRELASDLA